MHTGIVVRRVTIHGERCVCIGVDRNLAIRTECLFHFNPDDRVDTDVHGGVVVDSEKVRFVIVVEQNLLVVDHGQIMIQICLGVIVVGRALEVHLEICQLVVVVEIQSIVQELDVIGDMFLLDVVLELVDLTDHGNQLFTMGVDVLIHLDVRFIGRVFAGIVRCVQIGTVCTFDRTDDDVVLQREVHPSVQDRRTPVDDKCHTI